MAIHQLSGVRVLDCQAVEIISPIDSNLLREALLLALKHDDAAVRLTLVMMTGGSQWPQSWRG